MKPYSVYNVVGTCVVRIETFQELQEENEKLKSLIKDLVNNGMDADIARRIEELEIGEKYEHPRNLPPL